MKKTKRPRDISQLAASIVAEATGDQPKEVITGKEKNPHAVALGRLGGLKGGKARSDKLTKKRKIAIAKKAAKARWNKNK
ncbi:MAG: hypothetical protein ACXWMH_11215 [Syntrophales bacterium]